MNCKLKGFTTDSRWVCFDEFKELLFLDINLLCQNAKSVLLYGKKFLYKDFLYPEKSAKFKELILANDLFGYFHKNKLLCMT